MKTLKVQTAAAYLYQVQTLLKWCQEEQQLVTVNAALKVRVPKHTKNVRRRLLSLPDAQQLLDNCQDEELRFALYFSIHAGARYIECVMARPEWFNVKNRLIHIMASDDWMPKNKKNRVVPMTKGTGDRVQLPRFEAHFCQFEGVGGSQSAESLFLVRTSDERMRGKLRAFDPDGRSD